MLTRKVNVRGYERRGIPNVVSVSAVVAAVVLVLVVIIAAVIVVVVIVIIVAVAADDVVIVLVGNVLSRARCVKKSAGEA